MSQDPAFTELLSRFNQAPTPALWIVDENIAPTTIPRPLPGFVALTNRADIANALARQGWDYLFNDYQLDALDGRAFASIFIRIPKEKAQAHYLINQASARLFPAGTLYISGLKQEGIKSLIERAARLTSEPVQRSKTANNSWVAQLVFPHPPTETLDDKAYASLRQCVADDAFHFFSKPGIFGWDKVDQGSALLIEHLAALTGPHFQPDSILDLGCGYGYLALHAGRHFAAPVTATDNNAAAVTACQRNLLHYQVPGQAIAADCADSIEQRFALIVCNPPFHTGFSVANDLTERFIRSAQRHLQPGGLALFVTNLHIPLERKASPWFGQCHSPVDNGHFKLVVLAQPKP